MTLVEWAAVIGGAVVLVAVIELGLGIVVGRFLRGVK